MFDHSLRRMLFACFYSGDFVRDQAEVALARVKEFSAPVGIPADAAPATLACWAWGYSRMVDVLEKQPEIDAARIAAVGHSRNGKPAYSPRRWMSGSRWRFPRRPGRGFRA